MADGYYGDFKQLGINVVGAPQNVFKTLITKGKQKVSQTSATARPLKKSLT